jgi:hypothetical protein
METADKITVSRWANRLASSEQGDGTVSPSLGPPINSCDACNNATGWLSCSKRPENHVYVETLKKRFRRFCPYKDVTKVLLHYDNARPHTSLHAREAITKLQWTVLPHPPYSPDLAPSDYHLSPRKEVWRRRGSHLWSKEVVATETCREVSRRHTGSHISVA